MICLQLLLLVTSMCQYRATPFNTPGVICKYHYLCHPHLGVWGHTQRVGPHPVRGGLIYNYLSQDASNDPPHGLIQEVRSFQRPLETSTYKVEEYRNFQSRLKMSTHLYTWLGEHWNSVGCYRIFQSHLVRILVHRLLQELLVYS